MALDRLFREADSARTFFEHCRWRDGVPDCPHCSTKGKSTRIVGRTSGKRPARPGLWKCGACQKQFTVTVGTIFQDSRIGLHKWLHAVHLLCSRREGVGAREIQSELGITYKSAWFLVRRLRYAMLQEPLSSKLRHE